MRRLAEERGACGDTLARRLTSDAREEITRLTVDTPPPETRLHPPLCFDERAPLLKMHRENRGICDYKDPLGQTGWFTLEK